MYIPSIPPTEVWDPSIGTKGWVISFSIPPSQSLSTYPAPKWPTELAEPRLEWRVFPADYCIDFNSDVL